ncbi:MAG: NAD(P)/FAD-dependent oxidoreductase [Dehalococcoidales bacterium]|nr:NAD(P)/FAD-dependent oxidoreductase [Dehalococcoidales bacterium]
MSGRLKYDAIVVGSGPNGFGAAITLADSGHSVLMIESAKTVGGGMRSSELTLPMCIHDVCSAIHPLGLASPFFRSLELAPHGLEWIHSPAPLAHPLDDGTAVMLETSIDATMDNLGQDSQSYGKLMKPMVDNWDNLLEEVLSPLHFPRHPLVLSRFGILASQSAEHLVRSQFKTIRAKALFAGIAGHSTMPMYRPGSAAFGLLLGAAGHTGGWPIVKGGSQKIADALKQYFISREGEIRTGVEVRSLNELPEARAVFLDVTPRQVAIILRKQLSNSYRQKLLKHHYGPGIFKMDWVLDGPIPWKASDCLKAATVHIGGICEEIAEAENSIWQDKHPEKPLVLLAQQSLFDSTRAPSGKQTVWAYCHVPNGSTFDMSGRIEAQIERFAPGFRDRILARSIMNTEAMEADNPNYIGGNINGGVQNPFRLFLKPMGKWRPYTTPVKGVYVCSSSMPPGAGVHGMCGYHAARVALREMF